MIMNIKSGLKSLIFRPLVLAGVFLALVPAAWAVNLVQEFYLPMPEQQIYTANNAIIAGTGSTIASTFSIVVTGDNTVIYYDQWEDGYETDLSNPTQPTTKIWGDGNDAHGIPPGFAHNPLGLPAGTVITLTNNVPLPRNPGTILWDARDKIAATKALVISRAGWPIPTGPVFAGAAGVLSTIDYGTNYISPVGQNLTNNLFKYVGMFIMAAQDNTSVTIDPNGTGVGTTSIVLNQGESYLVNGGILKGGRVTSTKPIQADLIIGHVGASYASDWFTLYPVNAWDNSYYTPVGSAASGSQPAYVYLYNPSNSAVTINYSTRVGSGSFSVPGTNGVYQFQMPVSSGASFVSAGGQNFYALCTVAANNSSDTAYNWGFTLVPKAALTTEATVGWGPGSADGTVNGSPAWVTALASTKIYVDYKGDHAGPLSYTNGGVIQYYDTNFTVTALQSQKIFDPSKNQTGMRIFTVDGTLITGAWGEDPDTAQPGNPYIDAGTTVIPFPVPVVKKSAVIVTDAPPAGLSLGDYIKYSVEVDNKGLLPLGNTVVIDAPSTNLTYITNSTTYNGASIADSATGTPFPLDAPGYTIPVILSQGTSTFTYVVRVNASGAVSNNVNIGGTTISAQTFIPPALTNGATVSLNFTDTNGVPLNAYSIGANVYVTMTNAVGNTSSNSVQTISVTVSDTNSLDLQTITLTETGTNTGVFRNIAGLPTSATSGLSQQDGILNVAPGDTLSVSYTDPVYFDSASNIASILVPTPTKILYLNSPNGTNSPQNLDRIDPVAIGDNTAAQSVTLGTSGGGGGSTGVIGLDATNSVYSSASSSQVTVPVTVGNGTNRLMLVGISANKGASATNVTTTGTSVKFLSLAGSITNGNSGVQIWYVINPPAGTNSILAQFNKQIDQGVLVGVATFTNVDQTTPLGLFVGAINTGNNSISVTVTNVMTNGWVFDTVGQDANKALTSGAGQRTLWAGNTGTGGGMGYAASIYTNSSGATSITDTWGTSGNPTISIGAVPINPATIAGGGGGGTNTITFTQTPVFYQNFVMASNNVIAITNFVSVISGSMPANPSITATLSYGTNIVITLTNAAYNSGASNLVWTGTLSSNVTILSGQALSLTITNAQAGVIFAINYSSAATPSKILLPTTTVIQVASLGIYNAPYPGGSLVTAPVAGSTVYVRSVVTDPFGSYDITSLGLAVTGPGSGSSFTNTLTGANVVTNDNLSKTYEYQWVTGPTTGSYNIAVTAHEGTEGITATAAASITTTFLDLGTPSTTEFTSGPNGVGTNSYSANSLVSVRVTDLNRNTNAAAIDTVIATVTSSAGDSEVLTLFETGVNTGIFTNSINASASVVGTANNGSLYAPVGSILTASYTDPTDTSDSTSATATVQPAPGIPGVSISKTIVSPSGGQVGINQPVTYNLQVVNTGSTVLTNIVVTDNFPSAKLTYSSASPAPDIIGSGVLTWNTLGTFAPGQSTNLTVAFNTTSATGALTNSATVNGGTVTNSSAVTLLVNKAALNVVKILLSPTNTPVAVGSNVVFRITVQNVGNTAVNYLPLEDTFSGAYYKFVSSTITNNGSGAGTVIWTNLTYPVELATNAIITNDVTMKVVGQGSPANNTATVDFAVDDFGNPVPASSSTIGVNTATASINGHVYNDINQNGVYTNGDTGLSGVTLQLFTDPNGDGDPSDGTLVQITTSDVNGYYELLNLGLGHYVVVGTTLPGYISSAPANNRLAFNLTTLTASTNNNFFQYVPAPSLYSTINGTVWYDSNGNGTNDAGETNIANVEIDLVSDVNSNGLADSGEPVVASVTTDAGGNYSFAGVTPGHYTIREADPFGYYSTSDSQPPNDNQISFASTNGIVSTNNNFFDRLSPVANSDTNSALLQIPATFYPLTNDVSPNGDPLVITNVSATGGTVVINPGSTNLTFTPTNLGVTTIVYTIADAHGGTNSAIISVNVTDLADLAVGKTAAASVLASNNITYTISLTNFGPTAASSVVVTDTLPAGVTFVGATSGGVNNSGIVTWNLGTLTNGYTGSVTVTVAAPASGSLTNTASIGSPTSDPNPTNNVTPPVVTSVTPQADLAIVKAGPANIPAATNFTYTISVTNFGPSSASVVVVTDALPANVTFVSASGNGTTNSGIVTWNLGTLANSQSSNLTVTVTSPASGSLTNIAGVSSPTGDPNSTNNLTPPVITSVTAMADVSVVKSGPAGIIFGTNFNYLVTASNAGPSTATSLSVTDSLPAGLTFVSALPGATTNANNQVIWNLGSLTPGAATNLTLTVISTQRGSLTNVAAAGSPVLDPVTTNNTTPPVVTTVTNNPPIANPDSFAVTENTTNLFSPLLNDLVQTPGGTLTIIGLSPTNGTAVISGTNIIFTPALNFVGTATIGYTITDNVGGTNSGLITVTVANIPPTANPDSYPVRQNSTNTVSPLVNDTLGTPGGTLSIIGVSPTNGTASISGTNIVFVPAANFLGTAYIGYTITDGIGGTNTSLITFTVTNIPPIANPDSYAVNQGSTNTFSPLMNDVVQTPGGVLTIIGVSPTNGTAVISGTNIIFIPTNGFTGTASVGYTITDGIGGTNSSVITVSVAGLADIAIRKSGPATVYAATNFDYTITVTNLGPGLAASLSVTDSLPAGISFVSASAGGTLNGGQVVWSGFGSLAAGAATNLTVTVTAPVSGVTLTNLASGGSPTSDPNPTNNTSSPVFTTVTPVANLAIGKIAPSVVPAVSDLIYTISVTNFGPSTASAVVVTDALPAGVSFVGTTGGGVNNSGVVTWNLGDLVSGATSNVTVTVKTPAGGSLTNTARVNSPTIDTNTTDNVTPPVITSVAAVADVGLGKTAAVTVFATSNLVYTISVTNFGPSTASGVTVTDALPAGVTFVSASVGGTDSAGVVVWTLGDLGNGAVSNVTVVITAPASGTLTNVATVSSSNADPNPTNNITPPVVTTVTPVADLAVAKTGPAGIVYGANFDYAISVTNAGPSTAAGISVTDNLPSGLIFVSSVPATTTNASSQVIWTGLGDLAAGATTNLTLTVISTASGTVSNTAGVGSPTLDPNPTNNLTPPVVTVISQATPVVTWPVPTNIVYGTPLGTNQNAATAPVPGAFDYDPTNGTVLPAGTNTLTVLYTPADTNYASTNLSVLLVVTPAPLTIAASNQSKIYGAALNLGTSAFGSSGLVNSETVGSVTLTSAGTPTNAAAGTYAIVPGAATGGTFNPTNYSITYSNGVLTVNKAGLTVTASDTNRLYGATNPSFTAGYSGFVNGETTSILSGSPSLTTAAATNSSVGTYPIVATNGTLSAVNYDFTFVNGTLTVGQATLTVTANNTNKIYGAANPVFTASYSGFLNGDTTSVLSGSPSLNTAATTNSIVGTYPITATNGTLTAANYAFSFVNGTLTVGQATLTVTANNTNKIYGAVNPAFVASYSGFVNGDTSIVLGGAPSFATSVTTNSGVGGYPVTVTNGTLNAANYTFSFASGTLTVNAATLTVTANSTGRPYGTTNPVFTAVYSGFVNGETTSVLSGTPNLTTPATTNSPAGSYPIVATNGTLSAANYTFSFVDGTLSIFTGGYALSWTPPASIVYGTLLGTNQNNATATVPGSFVYDPTNGILLPAGTNTLNVVFTPTDTNYPGTNASMLLVVTPAPLSITASNLAKNYGTTLTLGAGQTAFTSSGLVNSETVGSVTLASAGTGAGVTAGNYPLTPSAATGGTFNPANYILSYNNGTLTVNKVALTVAANSTNKIYGAANPTFSASYSGFVNGDTTNVLAGSPSLTTSVTTNSGVGAYPIAATNGTLSAANYSFSFVNGALTVNTATLTVTANSTNRLYNTANPTFTASYSGFVNGETTSVLSGTPSLTTTAILSSPAGTYPINATNGTLSAANYAFTFGNGTLTIAGGTYSITWTNPVNIVYGTLLGTNQNNANATVGGTFTYNPTNGVVLPAGTNTLAVVFAPTDTNYAATNLSVQLVVTPAPLTITANSTNKPYNTTLALGTTAFTSSGLVNGETVGGVTLASAGTPASAPVGNYPVTPSAATGGAFDPANYSITYSNGTLTVLGVGYTVTWPNPASIIYGTVLGTNQNAASAAIPGTFTYNPTNGVVLPAGTNTLAAVFAPTDTNYAATNLSVLLVVTPAPLSVTASNVSRQYGQTNPVLGGTITGIQNGDNITAAYSTSAVTNSPAGSYPIVPTLVDPNSRLVNYSVTTNNGTLTVTNVVLVTADIAIFKAGPASGVAGSNLTYTITVTNLGPSTATNVLVKDLLPAGFTFVSAVPATATVASNLVSWPGFSLANNARSNFTVTLISDEGGSFTNIAFGTTDTFDPNPTNNNGTLTNSQSSTVVSPSADVAIFKTGPTNIYAGASLTYTIIVTNYGPSTATNVVVKDNLPGNVTFQSASGGYSLSNGVVTWPILTLAKGATTSFTVVMIAPTSGSFTNIALSTSGTADPNLTNNNGSATGSKVRTTITPSADVIVLLAGPTNVSVGDNFNYTITLTNAGPSAAAGVVLKDNLPASLTFIAASGGGVSSNNIITWPTLGSLANGATTNFTITVSAPGIGQFTNIALATSSTFDPNLTNNNGTLPASKIQTIVASAQFGILAGTPVLNPQTGLYEETVIVTNTGATTVAGVRLYVGGLRSGVTLYNATGTTNGVPYVQYNSPVNPGSTVTFTLEFYDANRLPFTHTLSAVAILPPNLAAGGTNGVAITKVFSDTRVEGDTRFVIEFTSTPGKTYTIIYSDDMANWKVATPSVTANATVTQWYDDGPPKTESKPSSISSRYYRVIQN
jgi:uncharacterized repeat protein (TIGR01451 family)